jgi:LuxR family transcriptional regulator, maltose regulon positive regulatory protein
VAEDAAGGRGAPRAARFAQAKFRPTTLPSTLVARSALHDRLNAGARQRLTVVVGSAGAGKSVLLSSWVAARQPDITAWLSCDDADANPVRFWAGFIEAPRDAEPGFGADAADLLAMDGAVSADVTASIANDAAKLPAGSAVVVDDFHYAALAVGAQMTDLIEHWPADAAQLVVASRMDPALRLHRLRMSGQLCELRDSDLGFSLGDSRKLLAKFGVGLTDDDLALLHQRSEGWAAALQMAALSLRSAKDPGQAARALQIRGQAIGEYFAAEVLDRQPPEMARFMLDTSILGELSVEACAAVTGRPDAGALLHAIDAGHLFLVALDEERTRFRYHHLVRQLLRAELRARDQDREQELQSRAAEWFEATGEIRRATRHLFAARRPDRALTLLQDQVVADFLRDPALPPPPDLSLVDPALLAAAPDRLVALALDLVISGDISRSGQYLDLLERAEPPIPPDSRLAARLGGTRAAHLMMTGQAGPAVAKADAARAALERAEVADEWLAAIPLVLLRAHTWLEDYEAVDREAATALAAPELTEPVKRVMVPGAQALAWLEAGDLARAAEAARTADAAARQLGFDQHFFAVDHLRALAGLALERRDLDTAERSTEHALSISERGRPAFEFLALLDRAAIWAARGQVRDALATIDQARLVLAGAGSAVLTRADELEALLRLSLGDQQAPARLAGRLPAAARSLLRARITLAAGDHHAAQRHLEALDPGGLTPRRALTRQLLLAAAAIERDDAATASILADAFAAARRGGFLNTVITAAPQVRRYLTGQAAQLRPDPFTEQLISAALQERTAQPQPSPSRRMPAEPLTAAEMRILKLLPASTYPQIATTLFISRNTVKTHIRSIYQKLGVTSRLEAIERALELSLL